MCDLGLRAAYSAMCVEASDISGRDSDVEHGTAQMDFLARGFWAAMRRTTGGIRRAPTTTDLDGHCWRRDAS